MNYQEALQKYNIEKKYSNEAIKEFVIGYTKNIVSDKLMTQFIKNIFNDGLSIKLTSYLTKVMKESGEVLNLSDIPGIKVDKHSTGGVGDKVSIIVAPIVSSLGGIVAKMSGRGLGFTGGTLDKLESVPNFNVFLTDEQFRNNIKNNGISLMGQTSNIVPADKKMYALRDETNYIASLPLIASSIMSKKLATGADAILLDVKCGDAAFMKNQEEAEELASLMINIGKDLNKDIRAEITSMDTPLGYAIGNKNEVLEAYNFLKGVKPAKDLEDVIFSSASTMLVQAKIFKTEKEALAKIKEVISNGKALEKFKIWIKSQNGNYEAILKDDFWNPEYKFEIFAKQTGFFEITQAKEFGIVAMKLGAGRVKKEDNIDYEAGIQLNKKTGDKVKINDLLFTLYSSKPINNNLINELKDSYKINQNQIIKKTILKKL